MAYQRLTSQENAFDQFPIRRIPPIYIRRIKVDRAKLESISKLPYPTNVKAIRSFLRHTAFYRRAESRILRAVVVLCDLKLKILGERGIKCIFVGYDEHSKAFRFSSKPKLNQRSLINGTDDDIGVSEVPNKVSKEVVVQQPKPRKSKKARTPKSFGHAFQSYLHYKNFVDYPWTRFVGKRLKIVGLKLNLHKSNLFGIGVDPSKVRSTLITSILGSLGIYFLSIFPMPTQVNNSLEKIQSNFFWESTEEAVKFPWIAWKSAISPKLQGGLGIGSLNAFNLALIQKWRWRFAQDQHSLWTRVITDIHGHSSDLGSCFYSQCHGTSVWARIMKSINSLNEKCIISFSTLKLKVNDGTEINQDCLVSDKWNGEWIWSWSRPITGGTIGSHLEELQNLVSNVQLGDAINEWQWNVLNNEMFTVKHTRLHIDHLILPSEAPATRWCKSNPREVNILV
ncbi:hypothetical protein Tco_0327368 [Tanacetum coccineum]